MKCRALEQLEPSALKKDPVASALRVTRMYNERNFVGMFKVAKKGLSLLSLLAIHWKLPEIFR